MGPDDDSSDDSRCRIPNHILLMFYFDIADELIYSFAESSKDLSYLCAEHFSWNSK